MADQQDSPRARAEAAGEDPLTRCEETGAAAIRGTCPVHGGDACLWHLPNVRATIQHDAEEYHELVLALTASRQRAEELERERDEAQSGRSPQYVEMLERRVASTDAALEEVKELLRPLAGMSPDGQGTRTVDVLRKLIARAESAERERDQERAARGEIQRLYEHRGAALLRPCISCGYQPKAVTVAAPCPPNAGATEAGE